MKLQGKAAIPSSLLYGLDGTCNKYKFREKILHDYNKPSNRRKQGRVGYLPVVSRAIGMTSVRLTVNIY